MFDAAGSHTNVSSVAYSKHQVEGKDQLASLGVSMSTQGSSSAVLMPINIKSIPLYLHTMVSNVGELRRHPNQVSRILHFDQGNYSLFANSIYQESLPGSDNTWHILTSKDSLSIPNKSFVFDTDKPTDNLYIATGQIIRAAPVKLSNMTNNHYNPLEFGETQIPAKAGKIVMIIRSSHIPNHFRIIYNTYTAESGSELFSNLTLLIDGASRSLIGWTTQESVGVELKPTGIRKRRDILNSTKIKA
jgi:hypothetical protein